jgi:acetyl-CoA carboxylase carboxyl transferase subunit beta
MPKTPKDAAPTPAKTPRERGGWLARFAPGVRNLVAKPASGKRETPENLWVKDPDTGDMIYRPDLEAAWWVTPGGRHMRIRPKLRFAYTFDDGHYKELPTPSVKEDPLGFVDDRAYVERLKSARAATQEPDAMAMATGKIGGVPAVVLVQDFAFMGGSLGMAAGEGFICAAQTAV